MSTRRSYKRRSGSVRRWRPRHACAGCEHSYERNTMRSADVLSLMLHRHRHLLNRKTRVEGCIHNLMNNAPHTTHKHPAGRGTGNVNTGTNDDVTVYFTTDEHHTPGAATPMHPCVPRHCGRCRHARAGMQTYNGVLSAACFTLSAACCMLSAACCMLSAA